MKEEERSEQKMKVKKNDVYEIHLEFLSLICPRDQVHSIN